MTHKYNRLDDRTLNLKLKYSVKVIPKSSQGIAGVEGESEGGKERVGGDEE